MINYEFEIMQNAQGEIVIVMGTLPKIDNPRFVYDGRDKMIFYPSKENVFVMTIAPEVREIFLRKEEVLVAGIAGDDTPKEYQVPIRHISNLDSFLK